VLVNRVMEGVRSLAWRQLLLSRRGRARADRAPVVFIPGMLGTRLVDHRGRVVWGNLPRLYHGPSVVTATRTAGLLGEIAVIPPLVGVDVYGGLVRFIERAGGYRPGEDLFVLDYDWRRGAEDGAAELARLVARIRGFGEERVDLVALSTGGLVARAFLAEHGAAPIRRIVYVGAPQRGSFDAIACLHRGFRFAPGGKRFSPREAATLQVSFDALPPAGEPVFVDGGGARIDLDLHDPALWSRLKLADADADFARRLERARSLHQKLAAAPHPADVFVIGACHLPTPARIVIDRGRAHVPPPRPSPTDPFVGFTYLPGDGELTRASLAAVPGLDEQRRLWFVTPRRHGLLPSDPGSHRMVVEALLATDRVIPATQLRKLAVVAE
jgi:hypothetical protein